MQTVGHNAGFLRRGAHPFLAIAVNLPARTLLLLWVLSLSAIDTLAEDSPYLLSPIFSSDPKMGNSLGVFGAYLYGFDDKSPTSMFGGTVSYSDSDSVIYAMGGKLFFHEDRRRLLIGYVGGEINNEYEDFLGTGWPARTTDTLSGGFFRYDQLWWNDWYWGITAVTSNYAVASDNSWTNGVLDIIGLSGFDGVSLGLMLSRDTRDNQHSPVDGSYFEISNMAFREAFGSDVVFDSYSVGLRNFWGFSNGQVLASRLSGRWTEDAPVAGYSSIAMRGYTRGEYLAPNRVALELEQRMPVVNKLGINLFAGVTSLFDDVSDIDTSENLFTSVGIGITYTIKQEEKMVVRGDLAHAESGRTAFYLEFGQAY